MYYLLLKENPTLANMLAKLSLERDREFLLSFVGGFFSSSTSYCNSNSSLFSEEHNRNIAYSLPARTFALVNILGFTKSRSVDVQLAAFL